MSRRRRLMAGTLFGALVVIAGSLALATGPRTAAETVRIEVQATPIAAFDNREPEKTRFGALEFRGGLSLKADYQPFGGISALHMEPGGSRFVAVTDKGSWLRGSIVYRGGKPSGIADAEMAPILGANGKPLAERGWYDTESLAETGGMFYVGVERVERIVRFDFHRDGFLARGKPIPVPSDFKRFVTNKGLECLTAPPKGSPHAGRLIAVPERSLDALGNLRAFLLNGDVVRFSIKRSGDFDISDCTILPPGDLLLLERSYSPARGVAMRIRRVPLNSVARGALVDGSTLIEANLGYQIDNMESIAVHRNAQGETVITLVSDDNFSVIQRNLLLQFALVGE